MRSGQLGTVLVVLRVIRGWDQKRLAHAAGLHASTVSEYERGKTVPELRTLERMVGAMDYSLAAVEQTRALIDYVRSPSGATPEPVTSAAPGSRAARAWELEQASAEIGRAFARFARAAVAAMEVP